MFSRPDLSFLWACYALLPGLCSLHCPSYEPAGRPTTLTNKEIAKELGIQVVAYAGAAGHFTSYRLSSPGKPSAVLDFNDPAVLKIAFPNGEGLVVSKSGTTFTYFGPGFTNPQTASYKPSRHYRSRRHPLHQEYPRQVSARDVELGVDLALYNQCGKPIQSGLINLVCTPLMFPQENAASEPVRGQDVFSYLTCGSAGCEGSCDINSLDAQIAAYQQCLAIVTQHPYAPLCRPAEFLSNVFDVLDKLTAWKPLERVLTRVTPVYNVYEKACKIYENENIGPLIDAETIAEQCGHLPEIAVTATGAGFSHVLGTLPATPATITATVTSSVSDCASTTTSNSTSTQPAATATPTASSCACLPFLPYPTQYPQTTSCKQFYCRCRHDAQASPGEVFLVPHDDPTLECGFVCGNAPVYADLTSYVAREGAYLDPEVDTFQGCGFD